MDGSQLHTPEARRARAAQRLESVAEKVSKATKGMEGSKVAMIKDRALEMPITCVTTHLKAIRGKSMTAAIKANCMERVGWDRKEVALCTAKACPLYPYRPFKE